MGTGVQDVRQLDEGVDPAGRFDVAIHCENIEHTIDDRRLMDDTAACLKPGGRLLRRPWFSICVEACRPRCEPVGAT